MSEPFRYLYHHGCAAITLSRPYPLDALPVARERLPRREAVFRVALYQHGEVSHH
jgi:hypothetical protein